MTNIRAFSKLLSAVVVLAVTIGFTLACGGDRPTGPSPTPTPIPTPGPTPPPAPTPHAVTHTLTMTASLSCTAMPEAAKKRTYPAQLQQKSNGDLLAWVVNSTDIMVGWANDSGFTGKRDANIVRFDITDDIFAAYAMIERIPGIGDMSYTGTATGTIDEKGRIVATFNGEYRLDWKTVLCRAPDHVIEVTPTDALTAPVPIQEVNHGGVA
jgi:hypothetical protein